MARRFSRAPLGSLAVPGPLYWVRVLRAGFSERGPAGSVRADGSVTLLGGGPLTVLVDTGGPWLRDRLPGLLGRHGVTPDDVTHVIVTHGHSDHAGNVNLFPKATLLMGFDLSQGQGLYLPHGLAQGVPLVLHPRPPGGEPPKSAHARGKTRRSCLKNAGVSPKDRLENRAEIGWKTQELDPKISSKTAQELAGKRRSYSKRNPQKFPPKNRRRNWKKRQKLAPKSPPEPRKSPEDSPRVLPTPGHTRAHVTLVASGTSLGTVAVAGDTFERRRDDEEDEEGREEWAALSEDPAEQRRSRRRLLALADVIVPGHGEPFTVTREWGRRQDDEDEDEEEDGDVTSGRRDEHGGGGSRGGGTGGRGDGVGDVGTPLEVASR
ncbi:metallo-beta-lactamase domain-containing protein 1 [Chamaea fasciata]|uniref:metallo-beta-lactamase domain-containing protein 1 n=1 Tax=Chamaea fasciata TaxID=190680 RepID=UPI00336AE414